MFSGVCLIKHRGQSATYLTKIIQLFSYFLFKSEKREKLSISDGLLLFKIILISRARKLKWH